MSGKRTYIHIVGAFLMALLGFASCSKPEDDPVNSNWGGSDNPYVLAYGPYPVSFQDNLQDPSGNLPAPSDNQQEPSVMQDPSEQ